jgi:hypothetical protein
VAQQPISMRDLAARLGADPSNALISPEQFQDDVSQG